MTVTTQRTADTASTTSATVEAPRVVAARGRRGLPLLVAGLAAVTLAIVGSWVYVGSRPTPAADVDNAWTAGYGPRSSTYNQQVPAQASEPRPWTDAYGPGSTVYSEQVPAAPRLDSSWAAAYGPGSSTYDQQVPAAARVDTTWTEAYGPGSSTYDSQVP